MDKDLCLLIKMPNPHDPSKNAIMVIGSRTHGVEYGARFLTDMGLLRELLGHRNVGSGYFCTMIHLNVIWESGDPEPHTVEPEGPAIGMPLKLAYRG